MLFPSTLNGSLHPTPGQTGEGVHNLFHHFCTVFELLDEDSSNDISAEEFESFGFLFNFQGSAVRKIFREFDVSGDQVSKLYLF